MDNHHVPAHLYEAVGTGASSENGCDAPSIITTNRSSHVHRRAKCSISPVQSTRQSINYATVCVVDSRRGDSVRWVCSPQTVAACPPCWCVSVCPGAPSPAVGPVGGWLPAPSGGRGWRGTVPGYGSDPPWPRGETNAHTHTQ